MIDIETLKELASKLMFTMSDEEYITLQGEFEVMLKQMDKIDKIEGLSEVEPLTHPFPVTYVLREDDDIENISREDVLANAKDIYNNMVVVPKVVGDDNE